MRRSPTSTPLASRCRRTVPEAGERDDPLPGSRDAPARQGARSAPASSSPTACGTTWARSSRPMLERQVGKVELAAISSSPCRPSRRPPSPPSHRWPARSRARVAGEEFRPCVAQDGKDLTPDRFRKLLADDGFQCLDRARDGRPAGPGLDRVRQPRQDRPRRRQRPGPPHPGADLATWSSASSRCWRPGGRRSGSSPITAGC